MIPNITWESLISLFPLLALIGLGIVALMMEIAFGLRGRIWNGVICLLGVLGTLYGNCELYIRTQPGIAEPFLGSLVFDSFSLFVSAIVLLAVVFALLLEIGQEEIRCGEVYSLTLLSASGMLVMGSSLDLFTLLLGLEVMSLAVYALAGMKRTDLLSNEAALKYFLLGAFSSGIFLYGIALVYGASGSVYFDGIASALNVTGSKNIMLLAGMGLILVGFGFKVALVPFHMWAPDVYEGAPTSVTAFMATAVKAAGFAGFLRVFVLAFGGLQMEWVKILLILATLTMTLGNLVALAQKSVKRMLAYSSIAHAGYILLALIAARMGNEEVAASAMLFYLGTYTFMTAGAFGVVLLIEITEDSDEKKPYEGLGWRKPFVAGSMAICLLSLAGIPPTAGFIAKFYVFSAALKAGYTWIVIIAIINSLISLYYYLKPLVWMYMVEKKSKQPQTKVPVALSLALILAVIGTLALGIMPSLYTTWSQEAAQALLPLSAVAGR